MISIIGVGVTGEALQKSFTLKEIKQSNYDKYKNIGNIEDCLKSEIIFLCLPTPYDSQIKEYNKESIYEIVEYLSKNNYIGSIVLKSTVEPQTTEKLYDKFNNINLIHNPEFLSSSTAFEDFHNQNHIVIGKQVNCSDEAYNNVIYFYNKYYNAKISECLSTESESMKLFVNNFYASKIQLFNEYYLLCNKIGVNYNNVKDMMLKNGWINPMHTDVPGRDGKLSYGGACFPKDTMALTEFMKKQCSNNKVLEAVIEEQKELRK
jgi:UDPglucose 6-dehydrogenase